MGVCYMDGKRDGLLQAPLRPRLEVCSGKPHELMTHPDFRVSSGLRRPIIITGRGGTHVNRA
jgi:hypothetical protein